MPPISAQLPTKAPALGLHPARRAWASPPPQQQSPAGVQVSEHREPNWALPGLEHRKISPPTPLSWDELGSNGFLRGRWGGDRGSPIPRGKDLETKHMKWKPLPGEEEKGETKSSASQTWFSASTWSRTVHAVYIMDSPVIQAPWASDYPRDKTWQTWQSSWQDSASSLENEGRLSAAA